MEKVIDFFKFVIVNWHVVMQGLLAVFTAFAAAFSALAGIFLLIPSEQPEKAVKGIGDFFHSVADFLAKFSNKPAGYVAPSDPIQPTPASSNDTTPPQVK